MSFVQVDGQVNPKLQSIHLERFPISTAHFTRDGTEVIMAGQKRSFFVYDMMAGKVTQIPGIRGGWYIYILTICIALALGELIEISQWNKVCFLTVTGILPCTRV